MGAAMHALEKYNFPQMAHQKRFIEQKYRQELKEMRRERDHRERARWDWRCKEVKATRKYCCIYLPNNCDCSPSRPSLVSFRQWSVPLEIKLKVKLRLLFYWLNILFLAGWVLITEYLISISWVALVPLFRFWKIKIQESIFYGIDVFSFRLWHQTVSWQGASLYQIVLVFLATHHGNKFTFLQSAMLITFFSFHLAVSVMLVRKCCSYPIPSSESGAEGAHSVSKQLTELREDSDESHESSEWGEMLCRVRTSFKQLRLPWGL